MKETQSESVRAVDEILKNNKPSKIGPKLEKSQEMVENLETPKFENVYQPAPAPENRNSNQAENAQSSTQNSDVDPFSSPEDNSPSWKGEKVNVDDYYNQRLDGSYVRKDVSNQNPSNQGSDNTMLIVVILIVGAGIIGALVTNSQKNTNQTHSGLFSLERH